MSVCMLVSTVVCAAARPPRAPAWTNRDLDYYDFSKPTHENYADPSARLRREFFATRAGLDYAYHGKYSLERQATQDEIVRNMLSYEDVQTGRPSPGSARATFARAARGAKMLQASRQPWAIFTAGCMGAGKTHVMCKLDSHGLLPLPRFVRVDIDRIRAQLPEMAGYVERDARVAGHMTQREAGMIAEVVTEEALKRGLNLWVDSSLRDAGWWALELQRYRRTFPHRLAIVHVTASWNRVVEREARRGEQTGRRIPPDVLQSTFEQVPAAVETLKPEVDEFIQVDNDRAGGPKFAGARDVRALLTVCRAVGGDCDSRMLEAWLPAF